MALDWVRDHKTFELIGGYFSPVSDSYGKTGLVNWKHRVKMCELATEDSDWLMVDSWEASQSSFVRTAAVLDHFDEMLNGGEDGGWLYSHGKRDHWLHEVSIITDIF